jgi:putative GTP pyrophosphokinase
MDTYFDANILTGTGLLVPDVNHKKIRAFLQEQIRPVRELMAYYQCAMMEVETKFKVLSQELSLEYDRNPIETI